MYQGLVSGLLFRGQEQERERHVKRIHRLRELEGGDATGPGWRRPASVIRQEPKAARTGPRGPLRLQWVRGLRPAEATV